MSNLKKSIIIALLASSLAISFVACSSSETTDEETNNEISYTATITDKDKSSEITEVDTTASIKDDGEVVKNSDEDSEETISKPNDTTTKKTKETTTFKSKTTTQASAEIQSISVNEALNVLQEFYGDTFTVNATINEADYQYFAVYDKNNEKYASVRVNLSTSEAVETISATGEKNEYNLSA